MKGFKNDTIRNVALLGHGGVGKTTLIEAALLATGEINRLGRVEDGNTVSDFDKKEIEKKHSLSSAIVPVKYKDTKINFIDTPGFFDFVGEVYSALRAAETAVIVVDAAAGIQVGTEKSWDLCREFGVPKFFLINKIDKENVDVDKLMSDLKEKFGHTVVDMNNKDELNELIAEEDEALMDKFFEAGEFTDEEFKEGLSLAILNGNISPVFSCSATEGKGIDEFLKELVDLVPKPGDHAEYPAKNDTDEEITVAVDGNGPLAAYVFKTIVDPVLGKVSLAKIISGKLKTGQEIYNATSEHSERLGTMFFLRGKHREDTSEAECGDIVAIAKLQHTKTGDTLCVKSEQIIFEPIQFPEPTYYIAIEPKAKGDEEKVGTGLNKLREEDPSFLVERNVETHQTLLGGQGDIQVNTIISKLKDKFGVDIEIVPQKIAYRETIKGTSDVQGKHKKQSGGAGQYGDVHIKFSPCFEEDFQFTESLFGGSIPKNYVPAIEKGLRESMEKGPLAGCKVVNIKADLYDGSYHDVDSNEMAFKIAASLAFKKGIVEAKPCLLEPIMHIEITIPDEYMGDIMGDMSKRRGRILGGEPLPRGGGQIVVAEAPQAELFDYSITLRAMTQARGSFKMKHERYDELPGNLADKIIAEHKKEQES